MPHIFSQHHIGPFIGGLALSVTILTTLLSIAIYLFYEEPAREIIRKLGSKRKLVTTAIIQ